jgi:putative transposase
MVDLLQRILCSVRNWASAAWGKLAPFAEVPPTLVDAVRSRRELLLENAFLRHQIVVLRRRVPRPILTPVDRLRLLLAARLLPGWRGAVALVQPQTILRWHRLGFRLFWRHKSRSLPRDQLKSGTVELIREMAAKNRLWGAERIRGELLKNGVRVSKRTIQKYMRSCRRNDGGQTWSTFIKNHAQDIWSCDFVQSYDLLFRPVFLFFVVHLASRRVVHVATTRNPSQEWTAQQIRNATMDSAAPKFLIRDRDAKFGAAFDRAATGAAVRIIKTAVRAPDMNAIAERFAGSLRREMLDHVLVLDDHHLARIAREYVAFFNPARPHQGIAQRTPVGSATASGEGEVIAYPVLGGLHHDYRRAA